MERLCIIPCGKKKIWDVDSTAGPTPAAQAYLSAFHRNCQAYARAFFGENWAILSARHGFLLPHDLVPENYDVRFSPTGLGEISPDQLRRQVLTKGLDRYDQVVVLGGKKFEPVVRPAFTCTIHFPLRGLTGIGAMNQALQKAVRTGKEL